MDELYDTFVVSRWKFAEFCRIFDLYVVDGLVDIIGRSRGCSACLPPYPEGLVQFYALR